jgi:hypothetical protein
MVLSYRLVIVFSEGHRSADWQWGHDILKVDFKLFRPRVSRKPPLAQSNQKRLPGIAPERVGLAKGAAESGVRAQR